MQGRRRSTWTSPIEVQREPKHGAVRPRRRRRWLAASAGGGAMSAVLLMGMLVGVDAQPALALCAGDGDGCVDTAGTTGRSTVILPLATTGDASLTVSNGSSSARAEVGVLGYLTDELPSADTIVRAGSGSSAVVTVARGEQRKVRLTGAPADARAVLVQVGSAKAGEGDAARVTFSADTDGVTRSELSAALREWTAQADVAMPSSEMIALISEQVAADLPVAAHLTATIEPARKALRIAWTLDAGTEDVTAVRVARVGKAADGSRTEQIDVPATEEGTVLRGLRSDAAYTVSVSPVIDGEAGASVVLAATTPAAPAAKDEPSASASASQTARPSQTAEPSTSAAPEQSAAAPTASASGSGSIPDAPAGWEPVYQQTFDRDAAVGGFGAAYPGYSGYDGGTDTSRTAGRAGDKTGLWNNDTTSSVHDGLYDCRLHTGAGGRPQVCALTPTPDGKYWSGQTYGRYTVRFKTDPTPGYKIAYLLWPDTDRWADGEIDFPEGSLDGTISGSVHDTTGNPSRNAYWVDTKKGMNTWQTATIEWTPGRVSFVLDGQVWTTTDASGMPRGPMRWALQAETEIEAQAPDPSVQGHIYIDWLAGYRYTKA